MHVDDGQTLATLIRNGRPIEIAVAVGIIARASRQYAVCGYTGVVTPERIVFTRQGDVEIDDSLAPSENLGYLALEILEAASNLTFKGGELQRLKGNRLWGEAWLPIDRPENLDWGPAAVFALGCMLWELLAGERLFMAENHTQALQQARTADVPVLSNLPSTLDAIIRKALARSAESRYANPGQLAAALEEWLVALQPTN